MLKVTTKGSFKNTENYLQRLKRRDHLTQLSKFGPIGVAALQSATPVDSHETAHSWTYEIVQEKGWYSIVWRNTHMVNDTSIAILLQYGHGTRNGGYVEGRDYINPAMRPIFEQILADMRKVVTK